LEQKILKNFFSTVSKMSAPKVLVGCPTSFHKEYALQQYAEAVKNLDYDNFDILLVDNSKEDKYRDQIRKQNLPVIRGPYFEGARDRIVASRNILRQRAIEKGYDYLFSLEQDVIPKKDALKKLIETKKKVVTAIYVVSEIINSKRALVPQAFVKTGEEKELPDMRPLTLEEIDTGKVMNIISCGLGCVLIHKDILKKIRFRYEKSTFDDRWFCIDLFKKKIPIYADTGVICKHLILNRPYQWRDIKK